jgi:hypothetical protein
MGNKARLARLLRFLGKTRGRYRELFMPVQLEDGTFISAQTLEPIPSEPVKRKLATPGVHGLIVRVSSKVVAAEKEERTETERRKEIRDRYRSSYT